MKTPFMSTEKCPQFQFRHYLWQRLVGGTVRVARLDPAMPSAPVGHRAASVVQDWPAFGVHGACLRSQQAQ